MDEKTEELRDVFMDVSEEAAVTESQTEQRGTLSDAAGVDEDRIREAIGEMRERYGFATGFEAESYVRLLRAFYSEATDEGIAEAIGVSTDEAFAARMDLHLLRDADTDAPFDLSVLRRRRDADDAELAGDLGVDRETVRRYRRVVAAQDAARAANHRYQLEFDELLTDADLSGRFTDAVQDDGLEEAAEDIETDVSF